MCTNTNGTMDKFHCFHHPADFRCLCKYNSTSANTYIIKCCIHPLLNIMVLLTAIRHNCFNVECKLVTVT